MEIDEAKLIDVLQRFLGAAKNLADVQEELHREGWDFFIGRMGSQSRITIPPETLEVLDLKPSDRMLVALIRLKKKKEP